MRKEYLRFSVILVAFRAGFQFDVPPAGLGASRPLDTIRRVLVEFYYCSSDGGSQ
jgi:hypothetical protein